MTMPPDDERRPGIPQRDQRLEPYIGVSLILISLAVLVLSVAISYSLMHRVTREAVVVPTIVVVSPSATLAITATPLPPTPPLVATFAPAATRPSAPVQAPSEAPEPPTAAAIPEATADQTAAAITVCGRGVVVDVVALNIRSEPLLGGAIMASVPQFEAVEVLCVEPVYAEQRVWRRVRYGAVEGWMSDRFLDIQNPGGPPLGQAATVEPRDTSGAPTAPAVAELRYAFPVRGSGITYENYHHDYPAADIFAPVGSEFVAPTSGRVEFVNREDRWSPSTDVPADRGGVMLALVGDDGVRYYGSHLLSIADGIEAGVRVETGQLLGYTGASGNAYNTPPHLHFGISRPTTPDDWQTRRGELPPYPYLKAWERGEMVTPDLSQLGR